MAKVVRDHQRLLLFAARKLVQKESKDQFTNKQGHKRKSPHLGGYKQHKFELMTYLERKGKGEKGGEGERKNTRERMERERTRSWS